MPADSPSRPRPETRFAFIGVRSANSPRSNSGPRLPRGQVHHPDYRARREHIHRRRQLQRAGTCFCVSMETGPRKVGFDSPHRDCLGWRPGLSGRGRGDDGRAVLAALHGARRPGDLAPTSGGRERSRSMGRADTAASATCSRNLEHPAGTMSPRVPGCASCTMVCPSSAPPPRTAVISPARAPSAPSAGTRASPWTSPTSMAVASAPRRSRATANG
jgi:hypothetical protein